MTSLAFSFILEVDPAFSFVQLWFHAHFAPFDMATLPTPELMDILILNHRFGGAQFFLASAKALVLVCT